LDRPSWRLDHVRLGLGDAAAAAAELRAAGFAMAELGQGAHALVLVHEHLELAPGRDRWPRLEALTLEPAAAATASEAPTALRHAGEASFAESRIGAADAALPLCRSRQLTPERLRTPARLRHPNGATTLAGLTLVVPAPRAAAAALAAVVGAAALTTTDRMVAAHLGRTSLLLTTPDDAELVHPDLVVDLEAEVPPVALAVALSVQVGDLEEARAVLAAAGLAHRRRADGSVGVRLEAAGLALELRGPA
jgi:hypothetical protein